jgi:ribosomal protein L40E
VSISAVKTEYTIGFILGALGVVIGCGLIALQFFNTGLIIDFPPPDPYSLFVGWAALGFIAIVVGAIGICCTYKIFIPLKEDRSATNQVCPHCGAINVKIAEVCEKCKQQIDT